VTTKNQPAAATKKTGPMLAGRQADSARRRQRVITILDRAAAGDGETSISGIARRRSRPHLLLPAPRPAARIHALEAAPPAASAPGPAVTRASLQADLLAAHERTARLATRIRQLEQRLSETLGEQAWRESGLGAPADIDALNHKIISLEQQVTDLRMQLDERDQDLAAARAANRELMAQLNTTRR
jgi:hypothetical protein